MGIKYVNDNQANSGAFARPMFPYPQQTRDRGVGTKTDVTKFTCFTDFFFQAEDGIRDYKVTGVQTCALPISGRSIPAQIQLCFVDVNAAVGIVARSEIAGAGEDTSFEQLQRAVALDLGADDGREIGRASCRERV